MRVKGTNHPSTSHQSITVKEAIRCQLLYVKYCNSHTLTFKMLWMTTCRKRFPRQHSIRDCHNLVTPHTRNINWEIPTHSKKHNPPKDFWGSTLFSGLLFLSLMYVKGKTPRWHFTTFFIRRHLSKPFTWQTFKSKQRSLMLDILWPRTAFWLRFNQGWSTPGSVNASPRCDWPHFVKRLFAWGGFAGAEVWRGLSLSR